MPTSIFETIKKRSSVYPDQFTDRSVTKEEIEMLLEAAQTAPSHKKTYPWRFKVFFQDALTALEAQLPLLYKKHTPDHKFSEFKQAKVAAKVQKSAAVIAICMQRDPKLRIPEWEEIAATAMAVQNMWLSLDSLSLGGYWSSPAYIVHLSEYLKLNKGEQCLGFLYLGGVDTSVISQKERPSTNDTVSWM